MNDRRGVRLVCLAPCLVAVAAFANDAQVRRPFTVTDDIAISVFEDAQYAGEVKPFTVAPDGQYVVVHTARGLLERNRSESTLRIYSIKDIQAFLAGPADGKLTPLLTVSRATFKDAPVIRGIRWLADSSGVAFLIKNESGNSQLFLAELATKAIRELTPGNQNVTAFDIRDARHFVFCVNNPAPRERNAGESSRRGTGLAIWQLLFAEDYPDSDDRNDLWAVVDGRTFPVQDPGTGSPIRLYAMGRLTLELSPDGRSIITAVPPAVIAPEWETQYPAPPSMPQARIRPGRQDLSDSSGTAYTYWFVMLDLTTGKMKPLTNAPLGLAARWELANPQAHWSPDGQSVLLMNTFLPPNDRDPQGDLNRPGIAVIDLAHGQAHWLERLKRPADTQSGYEAGSRSFTEAHFATDNGRRIILEYVALDEATRPRRWIRYEQQADGSWAGSAPVEGTPPTEGAVQLEIQQSLSDPQRLVGTDKASNASRVVFDPNPQFQHLDLSQASVYGWTDTAGRQRLGGLYKPSNFIPGKRYPLILQTHGFLKSVFRASGSFPTAMAARELTSAGFLVLQLPDAASAYSARLDEASEHIGIYEGAVRQLVKEGLVDPTRVGMTGFSRSCYYVLSAISGGSDVHLRAAVIADGIQFGYLEYLLTVDMNNGGLQRELETGIGGAPYGAALQKWLERSPQFNMDKVTAALQVQTRSRFGLLDMWGPYAALRGLHKPVDLLALSQGTHVLTNPAQRLTSQGGTVDWFRFWLQDAEDPDPAKAEQYASWRKMKVDQEKALAKTTAALATEDTPREKLSFPQKRGATDDEGRYYQSLGRFVIAPDTSYFLYEWQRPYNWSPDYTGLGGAVAARKETAIYKVNLTGEKASSEHLFYPAPGATYYMGNLSPDGKWLAFYELGWDDKNIRAGAVLTNDGISPRIAWFAPAPDHTQLTKPAVWLSNDELAYPGKGGGWVRGKIPEKEPEAPDTTVKARPCRDCSSALLAKAPTVPLATGTVPDKQDMPDGAKLLAQAGDLAIYSIDTPEKLALYFKKGDAMHTLFENDRRPKAIIAAEYAKATAAAQAFRTSTCAFPDNSPAAAGDQRTRGASASIRCSGSVLVHWRSFKTSQILR